MTSGLRKIHKPTWIVILLILPVLMYVSIQQDPNALLENSNRVNVTPSSFIDENEFISYQQKDNQLTLVVKKPLKNASAVVYELKNGKKGGFLGELTGANQTYVFNVDSKINGFLLYDALKETPILKINF